MHTSSALQLTSVDVTTAGLNFMACHRWLEQARDLASDPSVVALVDDVIGELWDLGSVEGELGHLVLGAMDSVATAVETSSFLELLD